ncbi:MAG TPA: DUF58 domain-containing protein [Armatimonadetes bacterium]|nr:DUF58 domain-containing protein [Armatimonadota bacterium]
MNAPYSPASLVIIAVAAVLLLALLRARSPLLTVALIGPLFFFIVAAILHASQLFVMGAMVLGVALLSYLLSTLSLHHVAVSREVPTPLTAGEAAPFTLTAENKSRLPKVFLRISAGIPPGIDAVPKHHLLAVLWPGQRASLEGVMTAPARGAYPLAPVEVVATDPLGLFRRRRALPGTGEVLVYPRICRIEYHEYLGESAYGSTSPRHSVLPGHGLDFHSLRDYHPGDDLRRVDWKTSARMGRMVVIEFEPVTVGDVLVVLDSRASGPPLELAVTAAASWLGQILDQGGQGRLRFARGKAVDQVDGYGPEALPLLLEALARVEPNAKLSPADLAEGIVPGRTTLIITPFADEAVVEAAIRLQSGGETLVLLIDAAQPGRAGRRTAAATQVNATRLRHHGLRVVVVGAADLQVPAEYPTH